MIYDELYECWRKDLHSKNYTKEAFNFERYLGSRLLRITKELENRTWKVKGYVNFKTGFPVRDINAPYYETRLVERWFVTKYLQPFIEPQLVENNCACRTGKGTSATRTILRNFLSNWEGDLWFLQFDCEKYFDNLSHTRIRRILGGLPEEAFWILDRILDSWNCETSYASGDDKFGVPKGCNPSQWIGIYYLNDIDWLIRDMALEYVRYQDDGIAFFRTKEECKRCKQLIEQELSKGYGVRLNQKKTAYAPISRGFTFCGWRYTGTGSSVQVRLSTRTRKYQKRTLNRQAKLVREGKLDPEILQQSLKHRLNYIKQGDTKELQEYYQRRYGGIEYEIK